MMEEGVGGERESPEGTFGEGPFTSVREFALDFVGNGQAPGILKEQKDGLCSPFFLTESGVQSRDPCLPLRGLLGPGHTPR